MVMDFRWLSLLFLVYIFATSVSASKHNIPRLGVPRRTVFQNPETIPKLVAEDFKPFSYHQTLDHFNYNPESYTTFKQRYVINSKYWDGASKNAPIFVYLGDEAPLDNYSIDGIGFLSENAPHFKALQVYIEHRYYGESKPVGSMEEAMKNDTMRGYFNSAQAIADYAEVIVYLKKNLSAEYSPVIVVGASYGGMLASWFRLKYPHVALGALASSAPILYFDDIIPPQNGYYSIVTKDFKEESESCYETIRKSWSEIDEVALQPNGLSNLSQRFNTCQQLSYSYELKNYLESIYTFAAQYNRPPKYPWMTKICGGIDGAPSGTDVLGRIFAGVVAYNHAWNNRSCYVNPTNETTSETDLGWPWQRCSEMVMPFGRGNDTMFPPAPFNLSSFIQNCKESFGVPPRPHWVTTYYGGHDIKLVLNKFGSNIIFSNGLKDPYSSGGVLEDISETLLAVSTVNGSHCLDILPSDESDPDWLVKQRKIEVEIIDGWIAKYYADLHAYKE